MGRWVTSQGRRIYIPDEGEKVPEKYKKNVVEGMTGKRSNNSDKEVTADAIRIAKLQKRYGMSDEQMQEAVKLNDYNVDKLERSLGTADKIISTVNKNEDTKEKQDKERMAANVDDRLSPGTGNKYTDAEREKDVRNFLKEVDKNPEAWKDHKGTINRAREYIKKKDQISKDADTKEKQIARNKAERDALNESNRQTQNDAIRNLRSKGVGQKEASETVKNMSHSEREKAAEEHRKKSGGKTNYRESSAGNENTWDNRHQLKSEIDAYVKAHPNPTAADRQKVSEMREKYNKWVKDAYKKEPAKQTASSEKKTSAEKSTSSKGLSRDEVEMAVKKEYNIADDEPGRLESAVRNLSYREAEALVKKHSRKKK